MCGSLSDVRQPECCGMGGLSVVRRAARVLRGGLLVCCACGGEAGMAPEEQESEGGLCGAACVLAFAFWLFCFFVFFVNAQPGGGGNAASRRPSTWPSGTGSGVREGVGVWHGRAAGGLDCFHNNQYICEKVRGNIQKSGHPLATTMATTTPPHRRTAARNSSS
jgi:hypothetical protein